ncbi:hypothetical protein GCM10007857_78450 [Bradyrhizobium iriomotense]|uniref:Uncharacterized protein n=1 Tax=Bradyrhizobium iriomotense TaxID=441950 RepID=A0ABQ6BCK3_9BRAD|nr:hypothetical protein GCM10007857_78450 [Bradyrhizobium iriomotense]
MVGRFIAIRPPRKDAANGMKPSQLIFPLPTAVFRPADWRPNPTPFHISGRAPAARKVSQGGVGSQALLSPL